MKKVFDQTVRDLKREVNKKVLKVPGIEQKVLDSTSNEPWGPHGSLLADIAAANRNYHEYQIIMTVIWKRISDTGKNWRHVYKSLVLLEYLVANGSERVIDEIREHVYQISTLSEFQYIDSSGRDQGINVRRKSQSLVTLVNDKERIIEVRQKAAANREKFRNISAGGMYGPGSYSGAGGYDDDRYEGRNVSRDEDRNGYGYGREKEWGYKDDDRHGRYSDRYSRDGDRYGRDYEDRYRRDGYREDEFRGRSHSIDTYRHGSRSRSSDRDRERSFDDDGQYSSHSSGARADEHSQDGRRMERKFSEQNLGAPPSYEEAVSETRSPVYSERDAEASAASAPTSSPPVNNQPAPSSANNHPSASLHARNHPASSPTSHHPSQENSAHGFTASPVKHEVEAADEFDPRVPVSAIPVTNNAEMDLLGSLSDSFASNSLAVVPSKSPYATSEVETHVNSGSTPTFAAASPPSSNFSQSFEDPFGDGPFKAIPSIDATQAQPQTSISADSMQPGMNQIVEPIHDVQKADMGSNFEFADALSGLTYSTSDMYSVHSPTSLQSLPQEMSSSQQDIDILADILPPSGPMHAIPSQTAISGPGAQPGQSGGSNFGTYELNPGAIVPANTVPQTQSGSSSQQSGGNCLPYGGSTVPGTSYTTPQTSSGPTAYFNNGNFVPQQVGFTAPNSGNFYSQQGFTAPNSGNFYSQQGFTVPNHANYYSQGGSQRGNQSMVGPPSQFSGGNFLPQQGISAGVSPQVTHQAPTGLPSQHNNNILGNIASQTSQQQALPSSSGSLAAVGQSAKDKFVSKSAVWADTLSRGLVNLNISGPKTNPMADIGVDFDAINRKEKRMEKQPAQAPVTSTVNMGKAMGTGSGLGRAGAGAGAGALRPQANIMMGSGVGMGGVPGGGMSIGGYGGMNQPMGGMGMGVNPSMGLGMGVNPGMGMGIGMNPGMGMNMGMGQGVPMQMPSGLPPSSNMSGYNPMMGPGGYGQQPYGGNQY